jgi:hypothetical protein
MDDHAAVVPQRATGYHPAGDGFAVSMSNWEQLGDGAVQTSIDDITKWDANFYTAKVGGRAMIDALTTVHHLESGAPTSYGLGLFVDEYRGLPVVRHGGSWAGYRSELLRFPVERLSIAVLCNRGEANAETRADRVADVVLQGRFSKPVPPAGAKPQPADTRSLTKFAGVYWNPERMEVVRFQEGEHGLALVGDGGLRPLADTGEGTYGASGLRVRFVDDSPRRIERLGRGGAVTSLTAAEAWKPDAAALDIYTGTWVSEELQARWVFERDGDVLVVRDLRSAPRRWTPAVRDVFTSSFLVIKFLPRDGPTTEMVVGAGRARGMRFVRQR